MKRRFYQIFLATVLSLFLISVLPINAKDSLIGNHAKNFGIDDLSFKPAAELNNNFSDIAYSNEVSDTVYVNSSNHILVISSSGKIKRVDKLDDLSKKTEESSRVKLGGQYFQDSINSLFINHYIEEDYVLYDIFEGNEITEFIFMKSNKLGIINPYNSIKVGFDSNTGNLLYFNAIDLYT